MEELLQTAMGKSIASQGRKEGGSARLSDGPGLFPPWIGYCRVLNLVQVQKWSFALEKTTDFELDLV
jgi:hypothetical protein